MSINYFIGKLDEICTDAREQNKKIPLSQILVHASKYLDKDSNITTENGDHILSFGDVIHKSAMSYIFDKIKHQKKFWHIDNSMYSPLHYAAMHDLDDIFNHATNNCHIIGKDRLQNLALHVHPETKHSTSSLLISRDKTDILHNFMYKSISISPFESEFQDIYSTWLHDAISSDSKQTSLYLFRNHKNSMKNSLKRSVNDIPKEYATPMDIALLSEHGHFYIDVVLSSIPCGLKINGVPLTVLICQAQNISYLLSMDVNYMISKCIEDTIFSAKI